MDCINIVEILVYLAICIIPTRFAYGIVVELTLNQENKFICFFRSSELRLLRRVGDWEYCGSFINVVESYCVCV